MSCRPCALTLRLTLTLRHTRYDIQYSSTSSLVILFDYYEAHISCFDSLLWSGKKWSEILREWKYLALTHSLITISCIVTGLNSIRLTVQCGCDRETVCLAAVCSLQIRARLQLWSGFLPLARAFCSFNLHEVIELALMRLQLSSSWNMLG